MKINDSSSNNDDNNNVNNNDDVFAGFNRGATDPDTLTYQSFTNT